MNEIFRSSVFDAWLLGLNDDRAVAQIVARLSAAEAGNFGDWKPVGEGVSEMRIHYGPGYRLYFKRRGRVTYVLLCGGTKSGQRRDIRQALNLAKYIGD